MRGSTGTRRKVNISFMKVHGTQMRCVGRSWTTRLHDGSGRNPEGPKQGSTDLTRRGIGRSKFGGWSRIPKAFFIGSQLIAQEKEQLVALLKRYVDVFAWTYDEMPDLDPGLVVF